MDTKDPAEKVTVTFDFSGEATACLNPVVSVIELSGRRDPDLNVMLIGSPQIVGMEVRHMVGGGIRGNSYTLRCEIDDDDGERWVRSGVLIVE